MTMEPFEVIAVDTTTVACDGGGGAMGHPRVYLTLGKEGEVECPYCSRKYVLKEGAAAAAH
ncbi:MAG TPA: zinc-finger domain-containing protein [Dongiaceae bacterium]